MLRGFTLLEVVCTLGLFAAGVSVLLPAARRVDERLSVVAAREELVGIIARARAQALAYGGATVLVEGRPATAYLTAGRVIRERVDLWERHRTELSLSGGHPSVEIRFDGVGLGRMAARSITLRRGSAVARLVVSAHGRVRRE